MNPVLPDEARALAEAAARAFAALGGVDAFRRAEADPMVRATEVAPAVAALGIEDLDPREGDVALAAAAALCEAAGRVALPYPVASALVRDVVGRPTAAIPAGRARVDHGDLFPSWRVAPLVGLGVGAAAGPDRDRSDRDRSDRDRSDRDRPDRVHSDRNRSEQGHPVPGHPVPATGSGSPLGTRLGPFVVDLADGALAADGPADVADVLLQQLLTAWTVLGALDRAVALAVEHVNGRIQFGKPLAAFQAVQFQLADAAVAVAGLRELAGFTLWRWDGQRAGARADVLALRLHTGEAARAVLRTAQQLHGAAGVCDEYDVSVLVRFVQPALRLPFGTERAAAELADAIAADGFVGLFPHGADLRAAAADASTADAIAAAADASTADAAPVGPAR